MATTMGMSALSASAACVKDTSAECYGKGTIWFSYNGGITWTALPHLDTFVDSAVYNGDDTVTITFKSEYVYNTSTNTYEYGYIDDIEGNNGTIAVTPVIGSSGTYLDEYNHNYMAATLDPQNSVDATDNDFGTYTIYPVSDEHHTGDGVLIKYVITECDGSCNCNCVHNN